MIFVLKYILNCRLNEIVNKSLLTGDKFIPELRLKQPGFTYGACGPLTKNKERIQTFKETGDTSYSYKNELDKACFQHDMAYGDFKDLKRTTASDRILRDKAFNIAKKPKYDGYQRGLFLWLTIFLIKSPLCLQINLYQVVISLINQIINQQMNIINQLLENFKKEKFILYLKIIFRVLI